jgi:hypothetical protein
MRRGPARNGRVLNSNLMMHANGPIQGINWFADGIAAPFSRGF